MALHSIREVWVPLEDLTRLQHYLLEPHHRLRMARARAALDWWSNERLRDIRSAVHDQAQVRLGHRAAVRLVRQGTVELDGVRIRLRALPCADASEAVTPSFDAKFNTGREWPPPDQAPKVPRQVWDAARSAAAFGFQKNNLDAATDDLEPIRTAALGLSMRLSRDDAARLVLSGAAFTRATWSKTIAYVVYARTDGDGDEVYLTVSAAPPLSSGGGG